jgi:hypothetical protein
MINTQGGFLALVALKRGQVEVNGQTVALREFNVAERAEFLKLAKEDPIKCQVYVVRTCVIGDDGAPLLDDVGAEALVSSAPAALDLICNAIFKLSGLELDKDDPEKNA